MRKVTDRQVGCGQTATRRKERLYLGGVEIYREYGTTVAMTLERETLHVIDGTQRVALVETRTHGNDGPGRSSFGISSATIWARHRSNWTTGADHLV